MIFDGPIHETSVCRIEFSWKMVSVLDRAVHLGVAVLLCLASATANAGESRALHILFAPGLDDASATLLQKLASAY
jgi:hypothetical protein